MIPAVGIILARHFLNALRTFCIVLLNHLGTHTISLQHCCCFFKIKEKKQKYIQKFRSHHIHQSTNHFFTNQETEELAQMHLITVGIFSIPIQENRNIFKNIRSPLKKRRNPIEVSSFHFPAKTIFSRLNDFVFIQRTPVTH